MFNKKKISPSEFRFDNPAQQFLKNMDIDNNDLIMEASDIETWFGSQNDFSESSSQSPIIESPGILEQSQVDIPSSALDLCINFKSKPSAFPGIKKPTKTAALMEAEKTKTIPEAYISVFQSTLKEILDQVKTFSDSVTSLKLLKSETDENLTSSIKDAFSEKTNEIANSVVEINEITAEVKAMLLTILENASSVYGECKNSTSLLEDINKGLQFQSVDGNNKIVIEKLNVMKTTCEDMLKDVNCSMESSKTNLEIFLDKMHTLLIDNEKACETRSKIILSKFDENEINVTGKIQDAVAKHIEVLVKNLEECKKTLETMFIILKDQTKRFEENTVRMILDGNKEGFNDILKNINALTSTNKKFEGRFCFLEEQNGNVCKKVEELFNAMQNYENHVKNFEHKMDDQAKSLDTIKCLMDRVLSVLTTTKKCSEATINNNEHGSEENTSIVWEDLNRPVTNADYAKEQDSLVLDRGNATLNVKDIKSIHCNKRNNDMTCQTAKPRKISHNKRSKSESDIEPSMSTKMKSQQIEVNKKSQESISEQVHNSCSEPTDLSNFSTCASNKRDKLVLNESIHEMQKSQNPYKLRSRSNQKVIGAQKKETQAGKETKSDQPFLDHDETFIPQKQSHVANVSVNHNNGEAVSYVSADSTVKDHEKTNNKKQDLPNLEISETKTTKDYKSAEKKSKAQLRAQSITEYDDFSSNTHEIEDHDDVSIVFETKLYEMSKDNKVDSHASTPLLQVAIKVENDDEPEIVEISHAERNKKIIGENKNVNVLSQCQDAFEQINDENQQSRQNDSVNVSPEPSSKFDMNLNSYEKSGRKAKIVTEEPHQSISKSENDGAALKKKNTKQNIDDDDSLERSLDLEDYFALKNAAKKKKPSKKVGETFKPNSEVAHEKWNTNKNLKEKCRSSENINATWSSGSWNKKSSAPAHYSFVSTSAKSNDKMNRNVNRFQHVNIDSTKEKEVKYKSSFNSTIQSENEVNLKYTSPLESQQRKTFQNQRKTFQNQRKESVQKNSPVSSSWGNSPSMSSDDRKAPSRNDGRAPSHNDGRASSHNDGRAPSRNDGRAPCRNDGRAPSCNDENFRAAVKRKWLDSLVGNGEPSEKHSILSPEVNRLFDSVFNNVRSFSTMLNSDSSPYCSSTESDSDHTIPLIILD